MFCKIPKKFTPVYETNKTEYGYNSEVALKCKDKNSFLNYDGEFVDHFGPKCLHDNTWSNLDNAKCFTG